MNSQNDFAAIAHEVVGAAFAIYNDLGRLFEEAVYQKALAEVFGARADIEASILVEFLGFHKTYRRDFVVDDWAVFELKTVESLNREHEAQLLNYLFLTEQSHGKLINFRAASVEHRFVNALQSLRERQQFDVDSKGSLLEEILLPFVREFGTGLAISLYVEFVNHFSLEERALQVFRGNIPVAKSKFVVLNENAIFKITSLNEERVQSYRHNLTHQLRSLDIREIQWANIRRGFISFETISK